MAIAAVQELIADPVPQMSALWPNRKDLGVEFTARKGTDALQLFLHTVAELVKQSRCTSLYMHLSSVEALFVVNRGEVGCLFKVAVLWERTEDFASEPTELLDTRVVTNTPYTSQSRKLN